MQNTWDLSILYTGFDDPAYTADLAALDAVNADINHLSENPPAGSDADFLTAYLQLAEKQSALASNLYIYASLRYSANTGDAEASTMTGRLMDKFSATAAADAVLRAKIASIDNFDAVVRSSDYLAGYRYFLENIRRDSRYLLSDKEESLLARLNISGASAWSDLQSSLTSSLKATFRGKEMTLSSLRNLAYDPDPAVREEAWRTEVEACRTIADSIAFSLNSIKWQVISECDLRGYASPLDKTLKQSRMKKETLDALLSAMEDYFPKFHQYLRAKAKTLGHEGGLPWYDLFAPMGSSDKKYTIEEARDFLLHIFGRFDRDLHDLIERAFDQAWIDFYPRDGKVGGAFDCGVPMAKQSRVLTNFDGSFSDIVTLAHELGHAFHDSRIFSHRILNQEYSMPVAETASTFNEVVVVSTAIAQATDKNEKLALIESQLQDACQIICDIYSRFVFESSVFENRTKEFMNSDRLCEQMLEAEKKAYGDGLDPASLHPYMWLIKGHYYSGDLSFYNFPYAFGGLFARGLYAKYLREGDAFVPVYKEMLHATTVTDVEECAKIAGIDLTDPAFWKTGLQSIADEIDEFCALLEA